MKNAGQKFIPSQTFLNEIRFSIKLTSTSRPEIPICPQTFLNEFRCPQTFLNEFRFRIE